MRFACLCHDLGKGNTPADVLPRHIGHEMRSVKLLLKLCERWRVPRDCKELAEVVAREHGHIHRCADLSAPATLRLLERCDAIRRPERFVEFLQACECDARGRLHFEQAPYPQATRLQTALDAALAVATAPIAARVSEEVKQQGGDPRRLGPMIALAIEHARSAAIAQALNPAQRDTPVSA